MTIAELIEKLSYFDPHLEVEFEDVECGGSLQICDLTTERRNGEDVVVIG